MGIQFPRVCCKQARALFTQDLMRLLVNWHTSCTERSTNRSKTDSSAIREVECRATQTVGDTDIGADHDFARGQDLPGIQTSLPPSAINATMIYKTSR